MLLPLLLVLFKEAVAASLTTYPAPARAPTSALFTVSVAQQPAPPTAVPVYASSSDARCAQFPGAGGKLGCPAGFTQAWASVWFSGAPITVTVVWHGPGGGWGNWSDVAVRPRAAGVVPRRLNDSALSFKLPPAALGAKLSLESAAQMAAGGGGWPAVVRHSLMLFADPESLAPEPRQPLPHGTLRFGPGVHDLGGQMPLPPNVSSVYVAGGAWLRGGFITTPGSAAAVTISGRGVISGTDQPFLAGPAGGAPCHYNGSYCWSLINMDAQGGGGTAGHVLAGVTLHDPPKYFFRSLAPNVAVRGVKMLGCWTPNSDGVAVGDSGRVSDTFVRSGDDSIKLFATGVAVADVTVWQGRNGAVFQLGWWGSHDQRDIDVRRVTVLHAEWKQLAEALAPTYSPNDAVFDLRGPRRGPGGGTPLTSPGGLYNVSNLTWRDVTLDTPVAGGGLLRMNLSGAHGAVQGLRFERLALPTAMHSSVDNRRPDQQIGGFSFVDLRVGGACAHGARAAGFDDGAAPADTTFECT